MAYFERVGESSYLPTEQTSGAWRIEEQHVAPSLGLLVHEVETDLTRRRDDALAVGRLSFDILGTMPVDVVDVEVEVLRPGRTIELVEAVLRTAEGRPAVRLRAWLLAPGETSDLAETTLTPIVPLEEMEPWTASAIWEGGFIAGVEVRRAPVGPGHGACWVRTGVPLVAGDEVSALARLAGLLDLANGMNVLLDPTEVIFPNLDATAHLFREPAGEWLGIDTRVSVGPAGIGLTASTLHDATGPFGTLAQTLTIRRRPTP